MRKTRKQLLGLAGLAAVGIMTAVACALPAPNAAAAEQNVYECNNSDDDPDNDCAKGENGAQVQVTVSEGTPTVSSSNPQDGSKLSDPDIEFTGTYSEVTKIDFYLTYKENDGLPGSGNGSVQRIDLNSITPDASAGNYAFRSTLALQGDYTLHIIAHGYNGAIREDAVAFTYRAVSVEADPEVGSNGDPSIDIDINEDVERIYVQVYSESGDPLFKDEEGNDVPIEINRSQINPETGKIKIPIPFENYGAEAGIYEVVITAKDKDDKTISMVTYKINYRPIVPEVPNSGANLFADLNITRIDYLLTGLIIFGLVAGFALYLICRKSRR